MRGAARRSWRLERLFWAVLGASLLLSACQSAAPAPDWVTGVPPAEYPPDAFLVAVGTGADLEEAGANAKAELARVFSAEIVSSLSLSETEQMEGMRSRTASDLWVETRIDARNEIEGAEIARHWSRSAAGPPRIWALAVLEKGPECRRIREAARRWMPRAEEPDFAVRGLPVSPLLAVQEAERALARGRALSGLAARSRVLGRLCVPVVRDELGALERDLREAQARIRFVFETEGRERSSETDSPRAEVWTLEGLEERLAEKLTAHGFKVGGGFELASDAVPIRVRLRLEPVSRGLSWHEVRWEGAFAIGALGGDPVSPLAGRASGSESHPEPATARLRARLAAEQVLAREIDMLLRRFLGFHEAFSSARPAVTQTERFRVAGAQNDEAAETSRAHCSNAGFGSRCFARPQRERDGHGRMDERE